jgi:hypothetical protein
MRKSLYRVLLQNLLLLPERTCSLKLQDDPDILRRLAEVDWTTAFTPSPKDKTFSSETVQKFIQQVLA